MSELVIYIHVDWFSAKNVTESCGAFSKTIAYLVWLCAKHPMGRDSKMGFEKFESRWGGGRTLYSRVQR
jgi:hypothetical protein